MNNLHLISEMTTNGLYNSLNIFSVITIFCGIFVIVTKNPILSILYLIGLFLTISICLMCLGINFIGLSYLLVYVGAVSILFLFILMLINVRISEIVSTTGNSIPLAIIVCSLFLSSLYKILPFTLNLTSNITLKPYLMSELNLTKSTILEQYNNIQYQSQTHNIVENLFKNITNEVFLVSSVNWDTMLVNIPHISALGNVLYVVYPLWLLLSSMVLLLAMVGAIVITAKN